MQNNSELLCSPPKQRGTSASLLLSFMFSFHPPRARTASLMHDPIARHCGGIQHQPTTRSIKYGGMAFKVMLNAPDTGGRASEPGRERAGHAAFVRKMEEASEEHMRGERLRGTVGRNIASFRSQHGRRGSGAGRVDF